MQFLRTILTELLFWPCACGLRKISLESIVNVRRWRPAASYAAPIQLPALRRLNCKASPDCELAVNRFDTRGGFRHVQHVRHPKWHKMGPTTQRMSDSSATFSGLWGLLYGALWHLKVHMVQHDILWLLNPESHISNHANWCNSINKTAYSCDAQFMVRFFFTLGLISENVRDDSHIFTERGLIGFRSGLVWDIESAWSDSSGVQYTGLVILVATSAVEWRCVTTFVCLSVCLSLSLSLSLFFSVGSITPNVVNEFRCNFVKVRAWPKVDLVKFWWRSNPGFFFWIPDHYSGFVTIRRSGINWHFAAYLSTLWTDFNGIFAEWCRIGSKTSDILVAIRFRIRI